MATKKQKQEIEKSNDKSIKEVEDKADIGM